MQELLKKLEELGASAQKDQALQQQISRAEVDALVAQHPNVCAYEHAPDDKRRKDDDDQKKDDDISSLVKRVAS